MACVLQYFRNTFINIDFRGVCISYMYIYIYIYVHIQSYLLHSWYILSNEKEKVCVRACSKIPFLARSDMSIVRLPISISIYDINLPKQLFHAHISMNYS